MGNYLSRTDEAPKKQQIKNPEQQHLLPPSRREALAQLNVPEIECKSAANASNRKPVRFDETCSGLDDNEISPTGFTVREIRTFLHPFFDFASLSGVPLPEPYTDFDIEKALPRSYRPFRWRYNQTMATQKLETDWWLELDNACADRIHQRESIYQKCPEMVLQQHPGTEYACLELMYMVLQFLCSRYPRHFTLSEDGLLHNKILDRKMNIHKIEPLLVLLSNVPEDFAIMIRNPVDGQYYFRAGMIFSSIGWSLGSIITKPLQNIHAAVPEYKDKLELSMNRYFAKMPTDRPVQRGSWEFKVGKPLFAPNGYPDESKSHVQDPELSSESIHLRVDWQTLRRLPLSGAIVFNFKTSYHPIGNFKDEPFIPALILKVLEDGNKDILWYKDLTHTEHVLKPTLQEYVKYQETKGLIPPNWAAETLEEYPFYPGWQSNWQSAQGFAG